jgi:hypothetical protein
MDAAAHMLKTVGDHIAPLTRFDASHLKIVACAAQSVPVAATQTFTARFAAKTSDGLGALPEGVRKVSGKGALEDALAEMLARATSAAARRLEAWGATHGADAAAAPTVGDIFASEGAIGYAWMCATCHGAGKIDCSTCRATGKIECVQCGGVGKTTCSHCNGSSQAPCSACGGRGGQNKQVEHRGWNSATNEQTVRYETVWEPCIRCGGQRTEHCTYCSGGRVSCSGCGGEGSNTCSACHGEGRTTCNACKGKGELHRVASVGCEIAPSLSIEAGGEDAIARGELSAIGDIDRLLSLVEDASVQSKASGLDFRRTTSAAVRCSAATFAAGQQRLTINGYGPDFEILDFRDIGGALLTGDVEILEAALKGGAGLIPALHGMLESETNAEIARRSGAMSSKKREAELAKLAAELRGVASSAYAVRASNAIRKGVSRAYIGKMMQWPVFTLAAGALALPANWLAWTSGVRNQDMPLIVGVMLLAIAAAFVGDKWATGALQKDLSSRADLKIPPLIGKLGLTRNWMILACILAIPLATVCGAIGRVWAGF